MTMKLVELLLAKPAVFTWNAEELRLLQSFSLSELTVIFQSIQHTPVSPEGWM
jgi:hypothetical protein